MAQNQRASARRALSMSPRSELAEQPRQPELTGGDGRRLAQLAGLLARPELASERDRGSSCLRPRAKRGAQVV